jgi:hypothetical protein
MFNVTVITQTATGTTREHHLDVTAYEVEALRARAREAAPLGSTVTFKVTEAN